jgi:precorrin-6B methylase 1
VESKGLNNLTRAKIVEGVRPALQNIEGLAGKQLHQADVSKILKEDLHLRYLRYDSAMVRYQDPTFDNKRLWVSRIMA